MKKVFVTAAQAITSLGFSANDNFNKINSKETGIRLVHHMPGVPFSFYASLVPAIEINEKFSLIGEPEKFTNLEKLMILSVKSAQTESSVDLSDKNTLLIISTTKGNVDILENQETSFFPPERAYLHELSNVLKAFFHTVNNPVILSNACISGVAAIIFAARLIRSGKYRTIVVCGGDIVSSFTISGFYSFKALASGPCKPYDLGRDGLNLGAGAGTVVLSSENILEVASSAILIQGGSITNDANHISGPSRTGEGLKAAMINAMKESGLEQPEIDYISLHGTATAYNDEMECKALYGAGLEEVPVNSFKGAFGHTLGAAGVIESALVIESMRKRILLPSVGFSQPGVTSPINVINRSVHFNPGHTMKTASGFGGGNAAVIFSMQ